MQTFITDINALPDTITLTGKLSKILSDKVEIVSRETSIYSSTFPAEIIICRLSNNEQVTFFCKYSLMHSLNQFGHKGELQYEAMIYDKILNKSTLSKVNFFGNCYLDDGRVLLVLKYIDGGLILEESGDPETLSKAATWIGRMHAIYESKSYKLVKIYDASYYHLWVDRVNNLKDDIQFKYPWLPLLCSYFEENIGKLTAAPQTLIHGEYYQSNILIKGDDIYPIDWESAAIAVGQIDLASLTEGWPRETVDKAMESYKISRWKNIENVPAEFDHLLFLARVYFNFRWLGQYVQAWMEQPQKFEQLYKLVKEAGYLNI